jgi:general transcriptional corepressor TUP1
MEIIIFERLIICLFIISSVIHHPTSLSTPNSLMPIGGGPGSSGGQFTDDVDVLNVPPELKKEGSDWFAVFNSKVKRVLDVSLAHTLIHERCVALQYQ